MTARFQEKLNRLPGIALLTLAALVLISALTLTTVSASVTTTVNGSGPADAVYVAGNPDLFPIESFNRKDSAYEGVVPDILKAVSKKTGLDFCYVGGSVVDRQEYLLKNGQVDMAVVSKEVAERLTGLKEKHSTFTCKVNGKKETYYLIFTEAADRAVCKKITDALSSIDFRQITDIAITYSMKNAKKPLTYWIMVVLGVLAVIILFALLILRIRVRKYNERKETDSYYDRATGLLNRNGFDRDFRLRTEESSRLLYYVAYYTFDIGHVNLSYGTEAAESMLTSITTVLRSEGGNSVMARVAGGSFAQAFDSANIDLASDRVQSIRYKMNAACESILEQKGEIVTAAICPVRTLTSSGSQIIDYLNKTALIAQGRKQVFMVCDDGIIRDIDTAKALENRVADAIKNEEIKLYVQPVVDNRTGEIRGGEALSRWENPQYGLITPGRFISLMNERRLTKDFDLYMFEQCCRCLENWAKEGYGNLRISCNFTRLTISDETFPEKVKEISDKYSFDRSLLTIEITEEASEKNKESAIANIRELKEAGFGVSMDNVGTGNTTFVNLYEYPIDSIKLDRKIVTAVTEERGLQYLNSLITMSHSLGLAVVCEGVEDDNLNRILKTTEADYLQGYFFMKAVPPEECIRYIKENG